MLCLYVRVPQQPPGVSPGIENCCAARMVVGILISSSTSRPLNEPPGWRDEALYEPLGFESLGCTESKIPGYQHGTGKLMVFDRSRFSEPVAKTAAHFL